MTSNRQAITVLLIDDQVIIAESLRQLLREESYIVLHYCQDPRQALQQVTEHRPDVILQDLVMPGIDGLDLVMQLKRDVLTRDVPLVVLSTKEDPKIKAEAFRLGANDYLVKLPSAIELVARLRYHADASRNAKQRLLAFQALAESREQLRRSHEQVAQQAAELERRNLFIQKTFGRYLSDDVVTQLLEAPDGLVLGGELRTVTIMMADLRGFTSTAGVLAPQVLMAMLNSFLGAMTDVIMEHRGMIDAFIGDSILAIFGAHQTHGDEADRAMRCALNMQHALVTLNARHWTEKLPLLNMGIAVHTGEVVVGNIGSGVRAQYGVVGASVNLASRIESMTVGGQVLVSEATRCATEQTLKLGERLSFTAKGVEQEVIAWELLGISGQDATYLPPESSTFALCIPPVTVRARRVENKQLSNFKEDGEILATSDFGAILWLADLPPVGAELDLQWVDGDGQVAFKNAAKVRSTLDEGVTVRFSVPFPQLNAWLAKRSPNSG